MKRSPFSERGLVLKVIGLFLGAVMAVGFYLNNNNLILSVVRSNIYQQDAFVRGDRNIPFLPLLAENKKVPLQAPSNTKSIKA
ncbi:hypothetical protein BBD42_09320 [Paenibacillus sp. BIHB 4019]|uniref:Uncharacterized protein n=1 Tax=Paenibacillus sp. BIHB 4019 TaxID=1870819 RepID=A0A1B2DG23_9BACL|nr:hypothetical protein [Paenibacillus sp. BIHB 4019]ANY66635.1 hypothetical protein BBD42_09320 [Paenibacillus sp. BIHB 4019]